MDILNKEKFNNTYLHICITPFITIGKSHFRATVLGILADPGDDPISLPL